MKFSFALALTALVCVAPSAFAKTLDLNCISDDPASRAGFQLRSVLIEENRQNVALRDSRGHELTAKKYAVVIRTTYGEGAPREEWEILRDGEFTLTQKDRLNYAFTDLLNRVDYVCSVNQEVHANPALTRTN